MGFHSPSFLVSQDRIPGRVRAAEVSVGFLLFLFVLFAGYGPAFGFAGQLRYVEAALLVIGLLYYDKFFDRVDHLEWKLSAFFLLTATAQIISNAVNYAPVASSIARVGTYVLLAALIPIVAVLVNRDWRRMLAVVFGYGTSYVVLWFIGSSVSETFEQVPWRLGLGAAVTLIVVALYGLMPRARLGLTLALFGLSALHLNLNSRSLAAITMVVAVYCLASTFWGRVRPAEFKARSFVAVIVSLSLFAYIGPLAIGRMATAQLLPDNLVTKNQLQAANSYGFLAAARPDTFTALYAISKRPLLGYGSGVFDAEVFSFYAEVNAASYRDAHLSRSVFKNIYKQDWSQGIPSHSHVFGAWADAGILAALSWFFVMWLDLKMLARLWRWGHPLAPLFVFVGIANLWDILFSPGPIRLDMAIRLVIMAMAFRYFDQHDAMTRRLSR